MVNENEVSIYCQDNIHREIALPKKVLRGVAAIRPCKGCSLPTHIGKVQNQREAAEIVHAIDHDRIVSLTPLHLVTLTNGGESGQPNTLVVSRCTCLCQETLGH